MINSIVNETKRISVNFATHVTDKDAEGMLKSVFGGCMLTERKLQSMVISLGLDLDLKSVNYVELRRYVGAYLHAFRVTNSYGSAIEVSDRIDKLRIIAFKEAIDEERFDFLYTFGRQGAYSLLTRFNVLQRYDIYLVFSWAYPLESTICYLFDSSEITVEQIVKALPVLKEGALDLMKAWDSRINWFKSGLQLDQKKIDVANLYFSKQKGNWLALFNLNDVRDFFYGFSPDSDKELIFRKIRTNYLNKKSREESDAKQCNFSLRRNSDKIIDNIAKSNGVTRSIVLNAIFNSENQKELQELFKKGSSRISGKRSFDL